ncbi:hypothetical protein [Pseudomonas salomonii]|uniref:Uncharacterized protein n=1 Tax=Pseudomonas salomonii TaxID=191391 RepID=A0ABS9GR79_9PSED|nr:hypothetical protein [Pseudomonas salomonii]MCF5546902.1 hypothetical protein [Pseudomonas salomonii]
MNVPSPKTPTQKSSQAGVNVPSPKTPPQKPSKAGVNVRSPKAPPKKPSPGNAAPPNNQATDTPPSTEHAQTAPDAKDEAEALDKAKAKVKRIADMLEHGKLVQMMKDPDSTENQYKLEELGKALNEESIKSLHKNPKYVEEVRTKIGELLSEKYIRHVQREATLGANFGQAPYDHGKADADSPWRSIEIMQENQRRLDLDARQRTQQSDPLTKKLIELGKPFQPPKTDSKPDNALGEPGKKPLKTADQDKQPPLVKPSPRTAPHVKAPDKPASADNVQSEPTPLLSDDAKAKLKQLDELLSPDNIVKTLRNPHCQESRQRLQAIEDLVSDTSLNAWLPDPEMQAKLKKQVRHLVSPKNLQALLRDAGSTPNSGTSTDKQPQGSVSESLGPRTAPQVKTPDKPASTDEVHSQPTSPLSDDAKAKLNQLYELLSNDSIVKILREPHTQESMQRVKAIEDLLKKGSLDTCFPDPEMQTRLKRWARFVVSPGNLQALLRKP